MSQGPGHQFVDFPGNGNAQGFVDEASHEAFFIETNSLGGGHHAFEGDSGHFSDTQFFSNGQPAYGYQAQASHHHPQHPPRQAINPTQNAEYNMFTQAYPNGHAHQYSGSSNHGQFSEPMQGGMSSFAAEQPGQQLYSHQTQPQASYQMHGHQENHLSAPSQEFRAQTQSRAQHQVHSQQQQQQHAQLLQQQKQQQLQQQHAQLLQQQKQQQLHEQQQHAQMLQQQKHQQQLQQQQHLELQQQRQLQQQQQQPQQHQAFHAYAGHQTSATPNDHMQATTPNFDPNTHGHQNPSTASHLGNNQVRRVASGPVSSNTYVNATFQAPNVSSPPVTTASQSWGQPPAHNPTYTQTFTVAPGQHPHLNAAHAGPVSRPNFAQPGAAPVSVQPGPHGQALPTYLSNISSSTHIPISAPPSSTQMKALASKISASSAPSPHQPERDPAVARRNGQPVGWMGMPGVVVGSRVDSSLPPVPETIVLCDPEKELGTTVMGRDDPLPAELISNFIKANEGKANEDNIETRLNGLNTLLQKDHNFGMPPAMRDTIRKMALQEDVEPVRSEERPTDAGAAAAWDSIGIVCLEDSQRKDSATLDAAIKQAVKNFGDFIKGFADKIKTLKQQFEAAADGTPEKEKFKKALAREQKLLHRAIDAASDMGDDAVLRNLGSNRPLTANLITSLRDCFNAGDFTGEFPKAILFLLSLFGSLPEELLIQRLKFDKLQKRFLLKGDDEVKELIKIITDKINKSKEGDDKAAAKGSPSAGPLGGSLSVPKPASSEMKKVTSSTGLPGKSVRTPSGSSPIKRPREDDLDGPASKKLAANPTTSGADSAAAAAKAVTKPPSTTATLLAGGAAVKLLPGKSRPLAKPAPRPEPSKEATKPAAQAEALKQEAAKVKKAVVLKAEPAHSSVSRLGSLLSEIAQPKKAPQPVAKMDIDEEPSETKEERDKRLRKEQRRKLRVTWKEGDALTEVRIFHKHAEEDEGRASNMTRHATDDRSEGMMLKQGLKKNLDEEDEDEVLDRPWSEPSSINFALFPEPKRTSNFISRGGLKATSEAEKRVMEARQMDALFAHYLDPADIPPSPNSPKPSNADLHQAPVDNPVPLPADTRRVDEIHMRWRESEHFGLRQATSNAITRLHQKNSAMVIDSQPTRPTSTSSSVPLQQSSLPNSEQVLAMLQSDRIKFLVIKEPFDPEHPRTQRRFNYPDLAVQQAVDAIEELVHKLKDKPYPATEPPSYISDPERIKEWWQGYSRDKERRAQAADQERKLREAEEQRKSAAARATPQVQQQPIADEHAAAWAKYYAQIGQMYASDPVQLQAAMAAAQQQQYAQQYAQQQQLVQAADPNSQLQAVLSVLGGAAATTPAAPAANNQLNAQVQALLANAAGAIDPAQQAYLQQLSQWAAGGGSGGAAQTDGANDTNDRRGSRTNSNGDYHGGDGFENSRREKERFGRRDKRSNPINRDLIGTKPCMFWSSGKCAKGDKCTFRHD